MAKERNEFTNFRKKRFSLFVDTMNFGQAPVDSIRILDVGGTIKYWKAFAPTLPKCISQVKIVNLDQESIIDGIFSVEYGDASDLSQFADNHFDVIHSNSVIEHVGNWRKIKRMAEEILRLAPRHFVQTPNFWFPFEPHYRRPIYQFLPAELRARLLERKSRGFMRKAKDYDEAMDIVESCNLLSYKQMQELFPNSRIYREKFLALTKSLVAIRS